MLVSRWRGEISWIAYLFASKELNLWSIPTMHDLARFSCMWSLRYYSTSCNVPLCLGFASPTLNFVVVNLMEFKLLLDFNVIFHYVYFRIGMTGFEPVLL